MLQNCFVKHKIPSILCFKLLPYCSDDSNSSGYFPGVWLLLKADVSEPCIGIHTSSPVEDGTDTGFRNVGF